MDIGRVDAAGELERPALVGDRLLLTLIAAAPLIFALATWNPSLEPRPLQDWARFLSIPVLAVECIALFAAMKAGARPLALLAAQPGWVRAALAALVLIALATALLAAAQPQLALIRTMTALLHLAFGLSLASLFALRWRPLAPSVWPWLVAGTCALVPVIALYVAAIPAPATFDWENFWLAGSNVRQLGFYAVVGAGGALGLAAGAKGRAWALWTLAAALMIALAAWSGTRSALVAIAAAFAFGTACVPALRTLRAAASAGAAFVLGLVLSLLHAPPNPLYGVGRMLVSTAASGASAAADASSGRLEMWQGALALILRQPLFGYGAGQYRFAGPESGGRYNHPHNLFLQLLVEWGAIGTLLFLAVAGLMWWRFHRAVRSTGAPFLPAFLVVNGLIAMSMIEGALYHPWPVMMAVIGFAFVLGPATRGPSAA
jgi:O-antigen ligase